VDVNLQNTCPAEYWGTWTICDDDVINDNRAIFESEFRKLSDEENGRHSENVYSIVSMMSAANLEHLKKYFNVYKFHDKNIAFRKSLMDDKWIQVSWSYNNGIITINECNSTMKMYESLNKFMYEIDYYNGWKFKVRLIKVPDKK
jgi:hypothetical protein